MLPTIEPKEAVLGNDNKLFYERGQARVSSGRYQAAAVGRVTGRSFLEHLEDSGGRGGQIRPPCTRRRPRGFAARSPSHPAAPSNRTPGNHTARPAEGAARPDTRSCGEPHSAATSPPDAQPTRLVDPDGPAKHTHPSRTPQPSMVARKSSAASGPTTPSTRSRYRPQNSGPCGATAAGADSR